MPWSAASRARIGTPHLYSTAARRTHGTQDSHGPHGPVPTVAGTPALFSDDAGRTLFSPPPPERSAGRPLLPPRAPRTSLPASHGRPGARWSRGRAPCSGPVWCATMPSSLGDSWRAPDSRARSTRRNRPRSSAGRTRHPSSGAGGPERAREADTGAPGHAADDGRPPPEPCRVMPDDSCEPRRRAMMLSGTYVESPTGRRDRPGPGDPSRATANRRSRATARPARRVPWCSSSSLPAVTGRPAAFSLRNRSPAQPAFTVGGMLPGGGGARSTRTARGPGGAGGRRTAPVDGGRRGRKLRVGGVHPGRPAVGRVGLEPTTNGLKVHCSAN